MKKFGDFLSEANAAGSDELIQLINMNLFKLSNSPSQRNKDKIMLLSTALTMLQGKDQRAVITARKLYNLAMQN